MLQKYWCLVNVGQYTSGAGLSAHPDLIFLRFNPFIWKNLVARPCSLSKVTFYFVKSLNSSHLWQILNFQQGYLFRCDSFSTVHITSKWHLFKPYVLNLNCGDKNTLALVHIPYQRYIYSFHSIAIYWCFDHDVTLHVLCEGCLSLPWCNNKA